MFFYNLKKTFVSVLLSTSSQIIIDLQCMRLRFNLRSIVTGIDLDDSSKGWIVSLDYVMTAAVAIVSGQLQVSHTTPGVVRKLSRNKS